MLDSEARHSAFPKSRSRPTERAWLLVIVLATFAIACDRGPSTEEVARDSVRAARAQAAHQLADRFPGAIVYDSVLGREDYFDQPYTVDMQRSIVDPGRPVLVSASLLDVARIDARYRATFNVSWFPRGLLLGELSWVPEAYFSLWVEPNTVDRLLGYRRSAHPIYSTEFLVVAQIDQVLRSSFTVEGEVEYDETGGYTDLHVEPARFFVVTGDLLDFVYIGE